MGTWGPAIFSDDFASDLRAAYRELLEDQVPDVEATSRIIETYSPLAQDDEPTFWLALAAAQSRSGRLEDRVRDRAIEVIDSGLALERWDEAGPRRLAARKAVLGQLRADLLGPQKKRSVVRRPWAHVTDLATGDILHVTTARDEHVLFRVAYLDEDRTGTAPILRRLDWTTETVPPLDRLASLEARPDPGPLGRPPTVLLVARHRKKDPDWSDVGFTILGRVASHPSDAATRPRTYTTWESLATSLSEGWHV